MVRAGGCEDRCGRMPGSATELNGEVPTTLHPKCDGYLGIVVPERKAKLLVQAINGRCLKCGYRLTWVVVSGKRLTPQAA